MGKSIIIGAGMGGLAAGTYGQHNGFDTTIFEAHNQPGGQCTRLEAHLREISPEDSLPIDEFVGGIRSFLADDDWFGKSNLGPFPDKLGILPFFLPKIRYLTKTPGTFGAGFKNPYPRRTFTLIRNPIPDIPLFAYFAEHSACVTGDVVWPRGGGATLTRNMTTRYLESGGGLPVPRPVFSIFENVANGSAQKNQHNERHPHAVSCRTFHAVPITTISREFACIPCARFF